MIGSFILNSPKNTRTDATTPKTKEMIILFIEYQEMSTWQFQWIPERILMGIANVTGQPPLFSLLILAMRGYLLLVRIISGCLMFISTTVDNWQVFFVLDTPRTNIFLKLPVHVVSKLFNGRYGADVDIFSATITYMSYLLHLVKVIKWKVCAV